MGVPNTLLDIRNKVRRLTARPSTAQISDAAIDQYINTYYLYDLPESLRLLKLKDVYTFITSPLVEIYPLQNQNYITIEGPAYCAGQQIQYFQDNDLFYREWPKINFIQIASMGNGTAGPYTGQLTGTPFLRSANPNSLIGRQVNVLFSANITSSTTSTIVDDGNGGFLNANPFNTNPPPNPPLLPIAGTINYSTGNFTINFPNVIPAGVQINAETVPFVASMPRTMLFYQNQFFMRPVPDKAYTIEINAFRFPTQLINNADVPELAQWWQLLAYGAALKILIDNADFDNAEKFRPYFQEQLLLVQRRTVKQLANQRSSTIYSNQGSYPYSNLYPYI